MQQRQQPSLADGLEGEFAGSGRRVAASHRAAVHACKHLVLGQRYRDKETPPTQHECSVNGGWGRPEKGIKEVRYRWRPLTDRPGTHRGLLQVLSAESRTALRLPTVCSAAFYTVNTIRGTWSGFRQLSSFAATCALGPHDGQPAPFTSCPLPTAHCARACSRLAMMSPPHHRSCHSATSSPLHGEEKQVRDSETARLHAPSRPSAGGFALHRGTWRATAR